MGESELAGTDRASVRIEPWGPADLSLLSRCNGDPAMMEHVGGPETPEKIAERQRRYEQPGSGQFKIVVGPAWECVGWVGYWDRVWRERDIYEAGWAVLFPFQGRGIAALATAQLIEVARLDARRRFLHAFPSIHNGPSNGICRKLGFELVEACEFEYPPGNFMSCNDWRLDLQR